MSRGGERKVIKISTPCRRTEGEALDHTVAHLGTPCRATGDEAHCRTIRHSRRTGSEAHCRTVTHLGKVLPRQTEQQGQALGSGGVSMLHHTRTRD